MSEETNKEKQEVNEAAATDSAASTSEAANAEAQEAKASEGAGVDKDAADKQEAQQETQTQEPDPRDAKIEELTNRLLRLQADFDNFRRRNAAEREQLSTFVTIDVVGKFLKVLDNFERAEAAAEKAVEVKSIITGMENIKRQFEKALADLGVKEIPAAGEKFDPQVHEAVMRGQNPEMEDDTIDAVFEKGYELNERVIRHSKVRVINND